MLKYFMAFPIRNIHLHYIYNKGGIVAYDFVYTPLLYYSYRPCAIVNWVSKHIHTDTQDAQERTA